MLFYISDNRLFKKLDVSHLMEPYLVLIEDKNKRTAICKLRLGSHNFNIERGRWNKPKTELSERICEECLCLEDEYHIIVECSRFSLLRKQLIPKHLISKPSMFKFIDFLNNVSGKELDNLARFCIKVFTLYDKTFR